MGTLIWNSVVAIFCAQYVVRRHLAGDYDLWFMVNSVVLVWCLYDLFRWARRRLK